MSEILLTQNSTPIFKYIVWALGKIMNLIFEFLYLIGIPKIGIAIILFTIVMYLLLMPLTIKQQKFSKLSAKMNPELQAIQAKYKNRKDQDSVMAMNQESQAVYAKYGVSPTGSCLQLLIQMPILFALYRVIYSMPAYITKLRSGFDVLVNKLTAADVAFFADNNISSYAYYKNQFTESALAGTKFGNIQNSFVDVLNRASSSDWTKIITEYGDDAQQVHTTLLRYNNIFGMNIGDSPAQIVSTAIKAGSWLLVFAAIMIPVLSAVTQWINVKLAPQAAPPSDGKTNDNPMASSMKMMNMIMPVMSAVFCYTLPAGMGIYWIAGAVVRTVQQIVINKHLDNIDIDSMMEKNLEKHNAKRAKAGLPPQQLNNNAKINTKAVQSPKKPSKTQEQKAAEIKDSTEYYNKNAKPGSLASKANMVKQYNEKNNKN